MCTCVCTCHLLQYKNTHEIVCERYWVILCRVFILSQFLAELTFDQFCRKVYFRSILEVFINFIVFNIMQ